MFDPWEVVFPDQEFHWRSMGPRTSVLLRSLNMVHVIAPVLLAAVQDKARAVEHGSAAISEPEHNWMYENTKMVYKVCTFTFHNGRD